MRAPRILAFATPASPRYFARPRLLELIRDRGPQCVAFLVNAVTTRWGLGAVLGTAASAEMHSSVGLVVRASQGEVVMLENSHRHALVVDAATRLEGTLGERVAEIQVGDVVREWCEPLPDGRFVARRIAIRREAWRLAESPEW